MGDITVMYRALLAGVPYPPPGVPDTPENRAEWERMAAWLDSLEPGAIADIPFDWADMPDD
jgi:hypothetical protein